MAMGTEEDIECHDFSTGPIRRTQFQKVQITTSTEGQTHNFEECVFVDCEVVSRADTYLPEGVKSKWVDCRWLGDTGNFHSIHFEGGQIGSDSSDCMWGGGGNELGPTLNGTKLKNITFKDTAWGAFEGVEFSGCRFLKQVERMKFLNSSFVLCDLRLAKFQQCNFSGSSILNCQIGGETQFLRCDVKGLEMTRFDLLCLKEFSDLTPGQRASMRVRHDLATLRASFSGFMQWIHIASILLVLMPYLTFIGIKVWQKETRPVADKIATVRDVATAAVKRTSSPVTAGGGESANQQREAQRADVPLYYQLICYAATAGESNTELKFKPIQLILLLFTFVYSSFRAFMLYTTKRLEHEEVVKELPSQFSLTFRPKTRWCFQFVKYGFAVNLLVAICHTLNFMAQGFPA